MADEAAPAKEFDKAIKELGDKIVGLTLKEAVDLGDYLKEEYGIEPASGGAVVMAGGGEGAGAAEEEEKSAFDVVLKGDGGKKIQVIKVVRELTGLGLKEAKEMVDNLPAKVKEGITKEEAEEIKSKIEEAGGDVALE